MKKSFLLSVLTIVAAVCVAQQKFNVQNGTKTEFYSSLDTAVYHATAGDTIYLPGMYISLDEDLTIDKKLILIGTGWDTDTIGGTQNTIIDDAGIIFTKGADGSLITGCNMQGISISDTVSNITIWRNKINGNISFMNLRVSNVVIIENWIIGYLKGKCKNTIPATIGCTIANNLIDGKYAVISFKNSIISNNTLRGSSYAVESCIGCTFKNNYFEGDIYIVDDSYFKNNAFSNTKSNFSYMCENIVLTNNLYEQSAANTFLTADWLHPNNLTIKDDSPCKNAGLDGTEIGMYGGSVPFKTGAVPFNPHINKASIGSQASSDGMLKIDITVSAQER